MAVSVDGDFYFPGYDNNGNVVGYWSESGAFVAEYAYDAFGNTLSATGPMAAFFSHRFSTKYFDDDTGLYYYGYRWYSPWLGRWISRDPIEEDGGENLYAFCNNSPFVFIDAYGDKPEAAWPKPDDREGWAIPGTGNFPGPGWRDTFRTRPATFFDFAAKIHDLH